LKKIKKYIILLIISVQFVLFNSDVVYSQQYSEYEVKAGYLYNFIKFVNWPNYSFDNEYAPFVIGIYGDDPFDDILENAFKDRTLYDRKWLLIHYNTLEEINDCNLLFISGVNRTELLKVLDVVKEKSILTIGDNVEDFCELGGIINFTKQNSKNRFEINNEAAMNVKLVISSKLLSLAKIINKNENRF